MKNKTVFISKGNKKVEAAIFNLPCVKTCKKGLSCQKYCYAQKAERLYPQVKPCRENNLKETKKASFIDRVDTIIKRRKVRFFRIHEAGDFYSHEYIRRWFAICLLNPSVKFYAYTKRDDLFTGKVLEYKPKNLTLILSLDGIKEDSKTVYDVPVGFDKVAITHKTLNNCNAIKGDNIKCMKNCFKCVSTKKETIIFKKH